LILEAKIFGFGSHFLSHAIANDIDLLIVHEDIGEESCRFAIRCKSELMRIVVNAHVTMLSKSEEFKLQFVAASNAKLLGTVEAINFRSNVVSLCEKLGVDRSR
jgi:hypothetical protein